MNHQRTTIRKACIIGSGVMGAAIAAHLANAGLTVLLLDRVPERLTEEEMRQGLTLASPQVRNRYAAQALQRLRKTQPAPLYDESFITRIHAGNMEDDLTKIQDADWIIEAVTERLDVKQQVLSQIARWRREDAIVSTNTSGISIEAMSAHLDRAFREHFLGTHFFNPPRYMKLLEIIPGRLTKPEAVAAVRSFAEQRLGKGVVLAKDTPNFIANRIGTYGLLIDAGRDAELGLSVDEVDAMTGRHGPAEDRHFRTAGSGRSRYVRSMWRTMCASTPPPRGTGRVHAARCCDAMAKRGWIGEKVGQRLLPASQGEQGSTSSRWSCFTMDYRAEAQQADSPGPRSGETAKGAAAKISKALVDGERPVRRVRLECAVNSVLLYAAEHGEIADSIVESTARCAGASTGSSARSRLGMRSAWRTARAHGSRKGSTAGVGRRLARSRQRRPSTSRKAACGRLRDERRLGARKRRTRSSRCSASRSSGRIVEEQRRQSDRHRRRRGRFGVPFPEQAIGGDILTMIQRSGGGRRELVMRRSSSPMRQHFCVGANLMLLADGSAGREWDEIDADHPPVSGYDDALKYCDKPVVAAPISMTLGGGVEVCLAGGPASCAAETYFGLVEAGVGLIPAGGGCKELSCGSAKHWPDVAGADCSRMSIALFETIGMAKVSTSGTMRGAWAAAGAGPIVMQPRPPAVRSEAGCSGAGCSPATAS